MHGTRNLVTRISLKLLGSVRDWVSQRDERDPKGCLHSSECFLDGSSRRPLPVSAFGVSVLPHLTQARPQCATLSQFPPRTLAPKTSGRVWNEMNGLGLNFGQVNPDISTTITSLIILPREAPTRPAIFNVSRGGTRGW